MGRPELRVPAASLARTGEARADPPTRCPRTGFLPFLPGVLLNGFQLSAVQGGIHFRRVPGIYFVQTFRDRISLVFFQEIGDRLGVEILLETPRLCADASAIRNRSSGKETAVFIPTV